MNRNKRIFAKILLIMLLSACIMPLMLFAYADEMPEPNFESAGISYYLSGPESMVITLDILGEQTITLIDGEEMKVEWSYSVPREDIGSYIRNFTIGPIDYTRRVSVYIASTLDLTYDRQAFEQGQQFLTGNLTQIITAYEYIAIIFPPEQFTFSQAEVVISELAAGNFESIENGNMQITFPVSSREMTDSLNPIFKSYLEDNYQNLELVSTYAQGIEIPPDFITMIIELITAMPTNMPTDMPTIVPTVTLMPIVEDVVPEIIDEIPPENSIPKPKTAEVIVGAVSSAVLLGVLSSAASTGASSAVAATAGLQQTGQNILSTASVGHAVVSFLRDIVAGLRDMMVDEGRAHTSGKVRETIEKITKGK